MLAFGAVAVLAAACGGRNGSQTTPPADGTPPPAGQTGAADPTAPPSGRAAGPGVAGTHLPAPPELAQGERLFDANCARCHGPRATGTEQGPPLVHIIYEPNHHSDAAFQLAAASGVRAHHWQFGDMPPVPGVTPEQVSEITGYVRWLQRQAGIE